MSWAAEEGAAGRHSWLPSPPLDRRPPPGVPEDAQAEVAVARKDVRVAASSLKRFGLAVTAGGADASGDRRGWLPPLRHLRSEILATIAWLKSFVASFRGQSQPRWGRWRAYRLKAIVPSRWSPCRSWLGKKTVPSEEVCRMALGADCVPDRDAAGTASVATWVHLHRRAGLCWCACTRPTRQEDCCDRGLVGRPAAVVGGHS
jgi:hypothetical protein